MSPRKPQHTDWRMRVFDSLSFPTLVLTPDREIVSVNRKFLEKFKVEQAAVVGKTCKDVFRECLDDDDLPCARTICPLDKTLTDRTGHSVLHKIKDKFGRVRWEDRVFSPILDDDGNVLYIIESVRDVTRTKRLEEMIHGIREFFNRVIQSSASAIVSADRNGRVLLMNQAAEELFGYDFENTDRIDVADLYQPGVAREIMKKLRDDAYGGRGKLPPSRFSILTASGEQVPVEMTGAIIYEDDKEVATMGIYNDLRDRIAVDTKLREAEAKVVQSEKMASLGRLAAGVAHEINNPLTGILMYGNILLENNKDEAVASQLRFIIEDAERCKDIVQNLLAYSRQSSTTRELFPLNMLVEESLRLIRDQKLFMNVTVEWALSDRSLQVYADRNKMRQVVINLVINAIDAMKKRGVLTLRTYPDALEKRACLEISDTGGGISGKDLTRVFDPFFTTKEPGQGTGLGLSTAYGIVKDNKGDISIKETGPEGTVFLVTLPLANQQLTGMPDSIG